jgi:hypothetical protein
MIDPFPIITLSVDAKPIRCPSRFRSEADRLFIQDEVKKLCKSGVIEPSRSPWRSQVVVVSNNSHKKRMCIDYASTVNRFTVPDAYPIPIIAQLLSTVATWTWYSYIDLKSAYYQLRLLPEEKHLTAFEAGDRLWQFNSCHLG